MFVTNLLNFKRENAKPNKFQTKRTFIVKSSFVIDGQMSFFLNRPFRLVLLHDRVLRILPLLVRKSGPQSELFLDRRRLELSQRGRNESERFLRKFFVRRSARMVEPLTAKLVHHLAEPLDDDVVVEAEVNGQIDLKE